FCVWRLLCSTLFPYTTLFRSRLRVSARGPEDRRSGRRPGENRVTGAARLDAGAAAGIGHGRLREHPHGGSTTGISWSRRRISPRSEEHTSELQSRGHIVCRLL